MPFYSEIKPLNPLTSKVITLQRLNTMLTLNIHGRGSVREGTGWRSSATEREVKGLTVPLHLEMYEVDRTSGKRDQYYLVPIGDQIDLRTIDDTAPQVDMAKDAPAPTLEQIEARYPPVTDPAKIAAAESLFIWLYDKSAGDSASLPTLEEKLKAIKPSGVSPDKVKRLAELIGNDSPETQAFAQKLSAAAYHPWGFLQEIGWIEGMTLNECRAFSWYQVLMHDHFATTDRIAIIDWKFGTEDVAGAIARVLGGPFNFPPDTPEDEMGYDLLVRAQPLLMRARQALVMLGDEGDSIAFTIVPKPQLPELLKLGKDLGLKPLGPERKGFLQSIFR